MLICFALCVVIVLYCDKHKSIILNLILIMKNTTENTETTTKTTPKPPREENQNLKAFKRVKDLETGKETTLFLKVCTNCKKEFVTHKRDTQTCSDDCQKDNKIRGGGRHIFYTKRKDVEADFNLAMHHERSTNTEKVFDIVEQNERVKKEYQNKEKYFVCVFYLRNSYFEDYPKIFKNNSVPCVVYFDTKESENGLLCFLDNANAQELENYLIKEREKKIKIYGYDINDPNDHEKIQKNCNRLKLYLAFGDIWQKRAIVEKNLIFSLYDINVKVKKMEQTFEKTRAFFSLLGASAYADRTKILKLSCVQNVLSEKNTEIEELNDQIEELNEYVEQLENLKDYHKEQIEHYQNTLKETYEQTDKNIRKMANSMQQQFKRT